MLYFFIILIATIWFKDNKMIIYLYTYISQSSSELSY